ncbi:hypothetical protein E1292_21560 [Nonomuraea deserti]|uniref:Ricin B lectin domain-containing protein n=1 Tax=Nonomuraea deserti TaxID=1848322 RepID=A0A4R4VST0_9ACTN|nr:hypothetical protein E1292_21560 [Nonomuraea deserti]
MRLPPHPPPLPLTARPPGVRRCRTPGSSSPDACPFVQSREHYLQIHGHARGLVRRHRRTPVRDATVARTGTTVPGGSPFTRPSATPALRHGRARRSDEGGSPLTSRKPGRFHERHTIRSGRSRPARRRARRLLRGRGGAPVGARIVWYQIIVEHSGQCLDVAHASTAHAADVVQATCGGPGARGNQTWRFRPVAFH